MHQNTTLLIELAECSFDHPATSRAAFAPLFIKFLFADSANVCCIITTFRRRVPRRIVVAFVQAQVLPTRLSLLRVIPNNRPLQFLSNGRVVVRFLFDERSRVEVGQGLPEAEGFDADPDRADGAEACNDDTGAHERWYGVVWSMERRGKRGLGSEVWEWLVLIWE